MVHSTVDIQSLRYYKRYLSVDDFVLNYYKPKFATVYAPPKN